MRSGLVLAGWHRNDMKYAIHLHFYVFCLLHGNALFLILAISSSRLFLNLTSINGSETVK